MSRLLFVSRHKVTGQQQISTHFRRTYLLLLGENCKRLHNTVRFSLHRSPLGDDVRGSFCDQIMGELSRTFRSLA